MKQLIFIAGALAILFPSIAMAQEEIGWSVKFYATEKTILRYCPKDGSTWHDHQFDERIYTEQFKKEIAICDVFQQSVKNIKLLEGQSIVYGFHMFSEVFDEHLNSDYVRVPVGPFTTLKECEASFQKIQSEGIGAEPCA